MGLNIRSKIIPLMILLVSLGQNLAWAEELSVASPEREITDALGRRVVMTTLPQRIVTVFSSNAETVVALGLADKIVGIDAYTSYLTEVADRPKIGGRLGISLEQVVAQKPDLVFMSPARQAVHGLLPTLEKMNIPTAVFTCRTVEEIMTNLKQVSILTGTEDVGNTVLEDMKTRFAGVQERRLNLQAPRVVFLTRRLPSGLFHAVRKGGYTADMVELSGGILALDQTFELIPSFPQISPEALVSVDPDIIIYTQRLKDGDDLGNYLRQPAFSTLKAHRQGHIYGVPSSEYHIPGPRVIDGVERLANIFDRWNKQQ